MTTISGSKIVFAVRENGTEDAFEQIVCQEDVQFQITNEVSTRRTNCGIATNVAEADFNASGNAVHEVNPTSAQKSYNDIKTYQKNRTKLDFMFFNLADGDIAEGDAVSITGSGYFNDTTYTAGAEADGLGSFSWSFTGTGVLDEYDDES